jgi:hypothetical protein
MPIHGVRLAGQVCADGGGQRRGRLQEPSAPPSPKARIRRRFMCDRSPTIDNMKRGAYVVRALDWRHLLHLLPRGFLVDLKTHGRDLLHTIDTIRGLSDPVRRRLGKVGLGTIEELLAASPTAAKSLLRLVKDLSWNTFVTSVRPQARLLLLDDVTSELAEALVRLGVNRYSDLVAFQASTLHSQLRSVLPTPPDPAVLAKVQLDAARAALTGLLLFHVTSERRSKALDTARITVRDPGFFAGSAGTIRRADKSGWIVSARVRSGRRHLFHIEGAEHVRQTIGVRVPGGSVRLMQITLRRGVQSPDADEFQGQPLGLLSPKCFVATEPALLADLPRGTLYRLMNAGTDGAAEATSLRRRRFGNEIRSYRVQIPTADLPTNVNVGDVVSQAENGGWRLASPAEIQQERNRRVHTTKAE